jgi:hypothetical protein
VDCLALAPALALRPDLLYVLNMIAQTTFFIALVE